MQHFLMGVSLIIDFICLWNFCEKWLHVKRWIAIFRFSDPRRTRHVLPRNRPYPLSSFCSWKAEGQNADDCSTSHMRSLAVLKGSTGSFDLQSCTVIHKIVFLAVQYSLVHCHQHLLCSFLPSPEYTKHHYL